MAEPVNLSLLSIGADVAGGAILGKYFKPEQIIQKDYNLENLMENVIDPPPSAVVCGPAPAEVSLIEVAQLLRMQYQESPIFYVTSVRENFERKNFQKNGFTDAFLLPLDNGALETALKDEIAKASKGAIKSYRSVKLMDVTPGQVLNFDTYIHLPVNNKYVKYSNTGDELDAARAEKLKKHQVSDIHVTKDQMTKFYEFTAQRLKAIGSDATMSETERQEKMRDSVRDLMSGMFTDASKDSTVGTGRQIISDCQGIVKAYIMDQKGDQKGSKTGWYERLMALSGAQANAYSHASNVATFAAMFSMGIGVGKPDDLALAGLLHDIGKADVPAEIQSKDWDAMTAEEKEEYKKHVDHSLNIIKARKMIVPENVLKMISQHHERYSGTGYPKGMATNRIKPESYVLAMANEFEALTAIKDGKPKMTPLEAIRFMKNRDQSNPSEAYYDPELLSKLLTLFPEL